MRDLDELAMTAPQQLRYAAITLLLMSAGRLRTKRVHFLLFLSCDRAAAHRVAAAVLRLRRRARPQERLRCGQRASHPRPVQRRLLRAV